MGYAEAVAAHKPGRYSHEDFWAKPVPGFGDLQGRLLVVGLAPARTGGLRTGRIFTGDASSRFLVSALYAAGFANQPISESLTDGLIYRDCYLTAAVKCCPPGDKPLPIEVRNCSGYLYQEIMMLRNLESILALGSLAFYAILGLFSEKRASVKGVRFAHGLAQRFEGMPTLYASYHPSPRNTNTGKLTSRMLTSVLKKIKLDFK